MPNSNQGPLSPQSGELPMSRRKKSLILNLNYEQKQIEHCKQNLYYDVQRKTIYLALLIIYLKKLFNRYTVQYIIFNNAWSYLFQCQSTGVSCLYTQTKANQSTCKTKINLFCYCFYNVTRFSTFQIQLANHAETKNNGQVVVKSLYFREALPFHLKYLSKLKIICQHTFWKESAEQRAVTDVEWNVYKL